MFAVKPTEAFVTADCEKWRSFTIDLGQHKSLDSVKACSNFPALPLSQVSTDKFQKQSLKTPTLLGTIRKQLFQHKNLMGKPVDVT